MWFLVIVAIAIFIGLGILANRFKPPEQGCLTPYERLDSLLTPAERSFFGVLELAVADQYRIFSKVRLADLFAVQRGLGNSERQSAFNKIAAKHVDFVLCEPATLEVVAAIELDDKSHNQMQRQLRDRFVDDVFASTGLSLGRVPAKKSYSLQDVIQVLTETIGAHALEKPIDVEDFKLGDEFQTEVEKKEFQFEYRHRSKPFCPSCGNVMDKQKIEGEEIEQWVCTKFPDCKMTMPIRQ